MQILVPALASSDHTVLHVNGLFKIESVVILLKDTRREIQAVLVVLTVLDIIVSL